MKKIKWIKIIIAVIIIALLSVGLFFSLRAMGVTDVESLREIIAKCGAWGWLAFIVIQVVVTTLLCFIPATSMTFTALSVLLWGAGWKAFIICYAGIVLSSVCMDLIGRFGGSKLIIKLIGQSDYESALNLLKTKGDVYVPIMYLLPVFPDDAICMCYGALKNNFWLHLMYIGLCRGIGCATICFGISILPPLTCLWDYVEVGTILAFWVVILFVIARKIEKYIKKRKVAKSDEKKQKKDIQA